jgi:hypothetical protein
MSVSVSGMVNSTCVHFMSATEMYFECVFVPYTKEKMQQTVTLHAEPTSHTLTCVDKIQHIYSADSHKYKL